MSRIARPLDPAAVAAANAKVAPKTGGKLLTMKPEDAALRKEWAAAYREALAEQELAPVSDKEPAPVPQTMGSSIQTCPFQNAEEPCNCSFKADYIAKKAKEDVPGENSPYLRIAMNKLWANRDKTDDPEVRKALEVVAKERGQTLPKVEEDWKKYQKLLAVQKSTGGANKKDPPPKIDEKYHEEFMGSKSQLRFGNVVGACLGIDPVFGALLNPTGGLVGDGNNSYDGNDSALGYHGAVHDAAGFLRNYHNKGPGYDYLGTDNRDTTSPYSGQRNGIEFWRKTLGDAPTEKQRKWDQRAETLAKKGVPVADALNKIEDGVVYVGNKAKEGAVYVGNKAKEAADAAYGAAVDAASAAWDWILK